MSVKYIIAINEDKNSNYDDMVGWIGGLNEVIQNKSYVFNNARYYEKQAKKGIYNCGHMGCSLMLYYIKQEDGFDTWYKRQSWESYHVGY